MLGVSGLRLLAFFAGEIGSATPSRSLVALDDGSPWLELQGGGALHKLDKLLAALPEGEPFGCGYALILPYDFGHWCDPAIEEDGRSTSLILKAKRITSCYVTDEVHNRSWIAVSPEADPAHVKYLVRALEQAQTVDLATDLETPFQMPADWAVRHGEFTRDEYMKRVADILADISRGDYYECNFTQRFQMESLAKPRVVANRLLHKAPRHAAWVDTGDEQILSASPESFLHIADGKITTGPIKGSSRRNADPHIDGQLRAALEQSTKDRAEHTMVVDMARNDLGRVCRTGSVCVKQPYTIEAHQHLYHMVSQVEGDLESTAALSAILHATFPPASVTGTPKIAATHAIRKYEKSPRGVYTGSLGIAGRGWVDLNVAIRTLHVRSSQPEMYSYEFGAGGAIVADSSPQAEYEECLLKAHSLADAVFRSAVDT